MVMLEQLQEIALRLKVDPLQDTVGHAARLDYVLKTLHDVNQSYQSYLKIEFLKNEEFAAAFARNEKVWESILEDLKLLVVDVSFSSFAAALAPDLTQPQAHIFTDEVGDWKEHAFTNFRSLVKANYEDIKYAASISERYTEPERAAIFGPLFNAAGDGKHYAVRIFDSPNDTKPQTLVRPVDKALYQYYVPKVRPIEKEPEQLHTVMAVVRTQIKDDGTPDLSRKGIKQLMYHEELVHDTYPYKPRTLVYEKYIYIFATPLECTVSFEEGAYFISYEPLSINVWGENREDAEDAFAFTFHALYEHFALAQDDELTTEAKQLRDIIKSLVKSRISDE